MTNKLFFLNITSILCTNVQYTPTKNCIDHALTTRSLTIKCRCYIIKLLEFNILNNLLDVCIVLPYLTMNLKHIMLLFLLFFSFISLIIKCIKRNVIVNSLVIF